MEHVLGLIVFVVFIACVIALAAGVTWLVVADQPPSEEAEARRGVAAQLDGSERQDVLERRVLEAVRLGDRLVGDLARRRR